MSVEGGNGSTRSSKRRKLRNKLRKEGLSEDLIEKVIARKEWEHAVRVFGIERARQMAYAATEDQPDDRGFQPAKVDPLLKGVARVTGPAAQAVKSGRTITKWQHDRKEAS